MRSLESQHLVRLADSEAALDQRHDADRTVVLPDEISMAVTAPLISLRTSGFLCLGKDDPRHSAWPAATTSSHMNSVVDPLTRT